VMLYSCGYLDGDPEQGRFFKWLCLTLAAVLTLIVAGNLMLFIVAWVCTSLSLHRLLTFYRDRHGARLAARKKFLFSRIADGCVAGAAVMIWLTFGTVQFDTIFASAQVMQGNQVAAAYVPWIAGLLVLAALLKSAQFPFHGWLPQVMETPTPVSALLHAGIINAGGYLILRMSGVVSLSAPSMHVLAIAGAASAAFAAVVMLTQNSIKARLAWSTCAQMGFMLMQCGLGALSSAALHIVAHALYKAHAFLSSGGVVLQRRSVQMAAARADVPTLLLALCAAVGLTLVIAAAFGMTLHAQPGPVVMGAVLMMGLAHYFARSIEKSSAVRILRAAFIGAVICAAYFALQLGAAVLFATALPASPDGTDPFGMAVAVAIVAFFFAALLLQSLLPARMHRPRWQAAFVHLFNGFYIDATVNRWVQRVWPIKNIQGDRA
jgi:NAD(P)H-quinone oxidoreductase subunit 5